MILSPSFEDYYTKRRFLTLTKKTDFLAIKEKQQTHLDNHRFGVTRQTFSLIYLQKFAQDDISRQEDYMLKGNNKLRSV